jgi:hypothetical protein
LLETEHIFGNYYTHAEVNYIWKEADTKR